MTISLIACTDSQMAIGYKNRLLTHLPNDLSRFKKLTKNKLCIMGRKTYESIVEINGSPLPNRLSYVLTRDKNYIPPKANEQVRVVNDFSEIVLLVQIIEASLRRIQKDFEVMICGGSTIYEQFLPYADTLYMTHIHHKFKEVDTFFPELPINEWEPESAEHHESDERHRYDYSFVTYKRINNFII